MKHKTMTYKQYQRVQMLSTLKLLINSCGAGLVASIAIALFIYGISVAGSAVERCVALGGVVLLCLYGMMHAYFCWDAAFELHRLEKETERRFNRGAR